MARLDFDFHARPAHPGKLSIGLLLAGVMASIWVGMNWQAARSANAGLATHIAAKQQAKPIAMSRAKPGAEDAAHLTQTQVAAQLSYSWQPAFDALSATRSNKIALVSLDASQAKSQLKLVAEARQLADAVDYIDSLEQQPGVTRAELLQHEVQADDAQKPVRFHLVVEFRAADQSAAQTNPVEQAR